MFDLICKVNVLSGILTNNVTLKCNWSEVKKKFHLTPVFQEIGTLTSRTTNLKSLVVRESRLKRKTSGKLVVSNLYTE